MDDEAGVFVHSTGITLSERFQLLQAERGPPGKTRGAVRKLVNRVALASDDNMQLLQVLANDPLIQRQLKTAATNQKKKNVKQRLGVKGRLGQRLQDRLGEVQYVRGGGGMARVRRGGARGSSVARGASVARGRGQFRGRGGQRGSLRGTPSARGRGSSVPRGTPRGRGGARGAGRGDGGAGTSRGRGARGRGRGGATNTGKKPTKEELDAQLESYMHGKADDDVLMS